MARRSKCYWPHVDGVPGVRMVQEVPFGQIMYYGFDLIEACECGVYKSDGDAAAALVKHRFGVSWGKKAYYGSKPYPLGTGEIPYDMRGLLVDTRINGTTGYYYAHNEYVAWQCSSEKFFVRRLKNTNRTITHEGVIKVPAKEPPMLKVPGRRAPGYLRKAAG